MHAACAGLQAPTASDQINGRWRLLYTSKPGTASPIQRTFTGQDAFSIFQVPCTVPSGSVLHVWADSISVAGVCTDMPCFTEVCLIGAVWHAGTV